MKTDISLISIPTRFADLEQYAKDFLFIPGFPELANGTSSCTWTIFLTAAPVLPLGVVQGFGLVNRQWDLIRGHRDRYDLVVNTHTYGLFDVL